ncbi:MAG: hypothetical protein HWE20_04025 [Gammaproteobacteria bacterium]|nr:hypothetical protein [Gammaproteobacteria bacterium]
MSTSPSNFIRRAEAGMASLIVVIVLLALLTITVLVVSRSTVSELRISSNDNRHKEAFAAAQAGLDRGAQIFLVSSASSSFSCGSSVALGSAGAAYCYSATVASGSSTITGTGKSADGSGNVEITEVFTLSGSPGFGELTPLLASGNVPTSGNYMIVPNPNSGGEGVPVSVWSKSAGTSGNAAWDTCQYDEFVSGRCTGGTKDLFCDSANESDCEDFVIDPCVADPFEVLFQVNVTNGSPGCSQTTDADSEEVEKVRQGYEGYFSCTSGVLTTKAGDSIGTSAFNEQLDSVMNSGEGLWGLPLIWITPGEMPSGPNPECAIGDIGSESDPVVVVVEGDVKINGSGVSYGIFYAMTDNYVNNTVSSAIPLNDLQLNGTGTIHGSILVNGEITQASGTGVVAYNPDVLDKLTEIASESKGLVRSRGSWRDF